jgi:hypothetical protein
MAGEEIRPCNNTRRKEIKKDFPKIAVMRKAIILYSGKYGRSFRSQESSSSKVARA